MVKEKKYTWATHKKELFEYVDIKEIQKKVIKLVSVSGLFINKKAASKIALKLSKMEINKRKDIIAAMYMHVTNNVIPANIPYYTNFRARWGISFDEIVIGFVDKTGEGKYIDKLKDFGFSKLANKLQSPFFVDRLKSSVYAVRKLDVNNLVKYMSQSNILASAEVLISLAREVLINTQEEELRYLSEDADNEEVLIFPFKLLNAINSALRGIQDLSPHLQGKTLSKLLKMKSQYEEIKSDIEGTIEGKTTRNVEFLALAQSKYERLREKWDRLADLNYNYAEDIIDQMFQDLKEKIRS